MGTRKEYLKGKWWCGIASPSRPTEPAHATIWPHHSEILTGPNVVHQTKTVRGSHVRMSKMQDHFCVDAMIHTMVKRDFTQTNKTGCQTALTTVEQHTDLKLDWRQARGQWPSEPDTPDRGLVESGLICDMPREERVWHTLGGPKNRQWTRCMGRNRLCGPNKNLILA